MKTFIRIFLTVLLPACLAGTTAGAIADRGQKETKTLRQGMETIHLHFNVNFIYDSSLDIDRPYTGSPMERMVIQNELDICLETLFKDTGIRFEVMKHYVVLTREGKKKPKDYTIFIEEQRDTLSESVITALLAKERSTTQTGFQRLDGKTFGNGFALLSSSDVIKSLQQLPGVATGTELLSGLYVRGGDGADNLYLLDDIPLYQVSHLAGLFSSFNTDVVESVDFYKSGFPARYGGRLSSVVDVRTRTGDMQEHHGLFSIGLLDGRLQFEGPIIKGKTSYNIGLRRSWLDVLTEPASLIVSNVQKTDFRIKYAFWDLNANITHIFSEKDRLELNIYGGRDALKFRQGDRTEETVTAEETSLEYYNEAGMGMVWGNFLTSLDWERHFSASHEMNVKAYFSRCRSNFSYLENIRESALENITYSSYSNGENRSRTADIGLKADFFLSPIATHKIRYGMAFQYHIYRPEYVKDLKITQNGETISDDTLSEGSRRGSFEPSIYIEDEIRVAKWLHADVGLRYSAIVTEGKTYHSLQPRAALRFDAGSRTAFKLSYSEMAQNDHQIASNYLQLPTNFWMPSTGRIAPSRSRQVAAGAYLNLPFGMRLNMEGYFKTMDNLLEFRGKWGLYPPIDLWEECMITGHGRSWGMETELSWTDENTSVTAYYTLSWSQRLFEEFYPRWYRDRNDNRHKLTLTATRRLGKRFEMYASWNWHSGGWMTSESQTIWTDEIGDWPEMYYEAPNNLKLPDYHRLDVGFNFRKTTRRGNESIWNLSIYNAYCNMNPIIAYIEDRYEFTKENPKGLQMTGEAFGIIPIIPSFSYTLKF